WDVVNTYSEEEHKRILWEYGEERYAGRIAHRIVQQRQKQPIDTTGQLSGLIREVMPAQSRETGHHPAKRSFQAIRIEVNRELDVIEPALRSAVKLLRPGGRICVLTFHSLEEKKVKQVFDDLATGCTCPKSLPVCVCGRKPVVRWISRKPVLPGAEELQINARARSAKLRIVEKI
ncbi:MAG: 16S rRNA (cytosine(1402)-N(4))-methyltransferase RsmH, partial [Clostridia bacterium]|nr:16S rRNA (cytosine(1402)-N(4))-methyltransferase RsmH [Clostridia bacterium]